MKALLFAVTLICGASPALAAATGVFVGSVGTLPIVLQLSEDNDTYYYRRYARDIQLERTETNAGLELRERGLYGALSTARLELQKSGVGWAGVWRDTAKKTSLPVKLHPVTAAELSAIRLPNTPLIEAWRRDNPYELLRFTEALRPTRTQTIGGKRVQWWLEPKSGIEFLRLQGQSKAVNDLLQDEHYSLASSALQCPNKDDGFTYTGKVALYSARLLSVSGEIYYDCGGAHPDGGASNLTLDLRSGKRLELEDLYRFAPVPPGLNLTTQKPDEPYFDYLAARAKIIRAVILRQFGSFTKKGSDTEGCEDVYTQEDTFQFLSWYLTPQGLVFRPSFPHVAAACEKDFAVPYQNLKSYLAPSSPLR